MRKTLIAALVLLLLGSAPLTLAAPPDENPTFVTRAVDFLETLVSWLGFSVVEEPEDLGEEPPALTREGDGEESGLPDPGGEAGPGWDPEG